jgi:hypothetical protein
MSYSVSTDVHVDIDHTQKAMDVKKGQHTPKSDWETQVFEHLVSIGKAKHVKPTKEE